MFHICNDKEIRGYFTRSRLPEYRAGRWRNVSVNASAFFYISPFKYKMQK
jgi:hypothetical protein